MAWETLPNAANAHQLIMYDIVVETVPFFGSHAAHDRIFARQFGSNLFPSCHGHQDTVLSS